MIELIITLALIGGLLLLYAVLITAANWIYCTYTKWRDDKQQQESAAAITTYYKVQDLVGGALADQEFRAALRSTIRKHHLGDRRGVIDFRGSDLDYLAELIAETVQQNRLWHDTLDIIKSDANESELQNIKEEIA